MTEGEGQMKKGICIGLAAILCLTALCACGKRQITVNDTPIAAGAAAYIQLEAERNGIEPETALAEYVAVNSAFAERGLQLTGAEKTEISQRVNALWRMYAQAYTEKGISKQDVLLVETSAAYRTLLMLDYYASDGDAPIDESWLQAYFAENYVALQYVMGFALKQGKDGGTLAMTAAERAEQMEKFERAASAVNEGASPETAAESLGEVYTQTETVLLQREDTDYPTGFFEAVQNAEVGKATVVALDDYLFLVLREDIDDAERNLYAAYRTDCLRAAKGAEFDAVLAEWAKAYTVKQ